MENECEALPGVAYPGVRDNRSTINTKTGYDDDDDTCVSYLLFLHVELWHCTLMLTQRCQCVAYFKQHAARREGCV